MSFWLLVISLSLFHHWSPHPTEAIESPNLMSGSHLSGGVPVVIKGDGSNGSGRQVIYVPPRAYLLCWKGVCDPRLWAEMAKRTPYYNFGLGKRSAGTTTTGSSSENGVTKLDDYESSDGSKRGGSSSRYNFGIGKKNEPNQRFNFGLGKREPQRFAFGLGKRDDKKNRFAFGLGKRDAEEAEEDQFNDDDDTDDEEEHKRQLYSFGLGKKSSPYNFGLGKRAIRYDFGLGKRGPYNFGLGKRSKMLYNFGLGKREINPMELAEEYQTDMQENEDEVEDDRDEKRAGPYSFGLGKRSIDFKRNRYAFGLGKRSVTTDAPLSGSTGGGMSGDKDTSRTTPAPTLGSHH